MNILEIARDCGLNVETCIKLRDGVYLCNVDFEKLKDILKCLILDKKLHFSTCLGVDRADNKLDLYYIVTHRESALLLKCEVSVHEALTPISRELPCCTWCELEIKDLLGVKFQTETGRFILPECFREVNPLKKTFLYCERPLETPTKLVYEEVQSRPNVVKVEPHPPIFYEHEDIYVIVQDGKIVDVVYRGFYNHRGIEKLGESRLKVDQVPFIAERICGICGFTHSTAYCQAVECALGVDIPESAKYTRSLLLELERVESHLLWIALLLYMLGRKHEFLKLMKLREQIMTICEVLTGNRKMFSINVIGGVRDFITLEKVQRAVDIFTKLRLELEATLRDLVQLDVVKTLREVGKLEKEDAMKLGVVGPVLRASGVDYDVRKYLPYAAYRELSFNVPVEDSGDVYARFLVRVYETLESLSIIDQIFGNYKVLLEEPRRSEYVYCENKLGVGFTEAPRGENIHFVITGCNYRLYRWKVRAPTYANLHALKTVLVGQDVKYANIIVLSLDPCLSCTDRLIIINGRTGKIEKKVTLLCRV